MSWLHRLLGKDGASQLRVEPTHFAACVTSRPSEVGSRGAYAASFATGVLPAALAANSEVFQFRWVPANTNLRCLVRSIRISAAVSTTAFAAGVPVQVEVRVARSWSAAGTGGTGITWGANDGKKRTDFSTTALIAGDVRIATTAALGTGTKTLDGTAIGTILWQPGTAVTSSGLLELWERNTTDEYPLLFENNEGFVVRSVAVPATGTWSLAVQVEWAELDSTAVEGWT